MRKKRTIWFFSASKKQSKYTDPIFIEVAKKLKVDFIKMDLNRFKFVIDENDEMTWYYKGEEIKEWPDLVFYRLAKKPFYRELFRTYCDLKRIRIVNKTWAIKRAKDKLWTHMLLAKHKIKSPGVALIKPGYRFDKKMKFPLVLKNRYLSSGVGTYLVNSINDIKEIVRKEDLTNYFAQEYIEESKGTDIRILLAGNKIIGAYKRTNLKDFKSNISIGGKAEVLEDIPNKLRRLAVKISKASGLDIIGVDFLIKNDDYLVLEINDLPGFKGFVDKNWNLKVDFATPIIKEFIHIIDEREKRKKIRLMKAKLKNGEIKSIK